VEYLEASIRSIDPCVSRIYLMYSPVPSHGFGTSLPCPDSADDIFRTAKMASSKIEWVPVEAGNEGTHRDLIFTRVNRNTADLILAVDADEVWNMDSLKQVLQTAHHSENRYFLIDGFVNFWRSFDWACYDHFHPVRVINLHNDDGQEHIRGCVYHFSTAQRLDIMRYKYQIFGHRDEVRSGWLEDVYCKWRPGQGNLHPVALDLWNAEPFDKTTLPDILKQHPNYAKQYID